MVLLLWKGRRRPKPRFCAAGAGGVTAVQTCVGGGAPAAKLSVRYIAARDKAVPLHICRVAVLLLRRHRGAAGLGELQWASRRRGNGTGTTIKYLRRTTSGAAGNGLGTTINYLRQTTNGTAGNGLGATIKYLRRTTSGAAGIGLGTTISARGQPGVRATPLRAGGRARADGWC